MIKDVCLYKGTAIITVDNGDIYLVWMNNETPTLTQIMLPEKDIHKLIDRLSE